MFVFKKQGMHLKGDPHIRNEWIFMYISYINYENYFTSYKRLVPVLYSCVNKLTVMMA